MDDIRIGVLGLQGSVAEHINHLSAIPGVISKKVKTAAELQDIDGLILPGGESTTLGKLLCLYGLMDPIREKARKGMALWGTCAGTILLAQRITNDTTIHLGLMDITVSRNAYGTQRDSFTTVAAIPDVSEEALPLVFIRAPIIEATGPQVSVLCKVSGKIAAARQCNLLATTFHPELTEDLAFHRYFIRMSSGRRF